MKNKLNIIAWSVIVLALLVINIKIAYAHNKSESKDPPLPGPGHEFIEVAEGVYNVMPTGHLVTFSNSCLIVTESEAIVVDSHVTPRAMRNLLEEIKAITDKPVRTIINSHYHYDHAHGNQIFADDDNVDVIGHTFTREMLLTDVIEQKTYGGDFWALPEEIKFLEGQLKEAGDAQERADLEHKLIVQRDYWASLQEVKPTPPKTTMEKKMTLYRGDREIQLLFLGRGHTGGDILVFLPKERVIFSGDFIQPWPPYMGDAYVDEWIETLEELKKIDFDIIIPGHGDTVMEGKKLVNGYQAYLKDIWKKTNEYYKEGVDPEVVAGRIDMSAHADAFPGGISSGIVDPREIERIYSLLRADEKGEPRPRWLPLEQR